MKVRTQFLTVFSLAIVLMLSLSAHAASDLTVVINGQTLPPATCTGGNCTLDITGTWAGVEISPNGGTPMIKATDGDPETLVLEKATIKALTVTEHVITFSATFVKGPSTDGNKKVQYDRTADGNMMRGSNAAKNDKFTINAWVDDYSDALAELIVNPTQYKLVSCVTPSCPAAYGTFNLAATLLNTTGFTGDRQLKSEIKFDAKFVNDKLNVTSIQLAGNTVAVVATEVLPSHGTYDSTGEEHIIQREKGKSGKEHSKGRDKTQTDQGDK